MEKLNTERWKIIFLLSRSEKILNKINGHIADGSVDVREWLSGDHAKLLSTGKFDSAGHCFKTEDETDVAGRLGLQ